MRIELTLEEAKKFIGILGLGSKAGPGYRALVQCIPILEKSLLNNVFRKPHSDTVKIESKRELQSLIAKSGKGSHKPAQAKRGAQYNQEYLNLKARYGEHLPHKFMNYGFWMGTDVDMIGDRLQMKVEPIFKKGFDYLSHHERNRSVLKRAFLDAWGTIINKIITHYAKEAKQ